MKSEYVAVEKDALESLIDAYHVLSDPLESDDPTLQMGDDAVETLLSDVNEVPEMERAGGHTLTFTESGVLVEYGTMYEYYELAESGER